MKNIEIIELYEALVRIENNKELIFDLKTAYAMAHNKVELEKTVDIIYKFRRKILLKYGEEDGDQIKIPNENLDACQKELEELMNMESSVKIMLLNIMDLEKYSLNLNDMCGLQYMIQLIPPHTHEHEHNY